MKNLDKGDHIGYGITYRTFNKSKMIVLPVGYFDGYDRKLSNISTIIINGIKAPVRGRVCMDMFMAEDLMFVFMDNKDLFTVYCIELYA